MGGKGWKGTRPVRKICVEEGLILSFRDISCPFDTNPVGVLEWPTHSAAVLYGVFTDVSPAYLGLVYQWGNYPDVRLRVGLTRAPVQWGFRWWFHCPIVANGKVCNSRCGKLYLPPGSQYFGCRRCHDLRYRSSQQAHKMERNLKSLGFNAEASAAFLKTKADH